MQNLKVIETNESYVVSSLEVADMIDRNHKELLRDLRKYVAVLNERNFVPVDFFVESEYLGGNGEE